jgi:sec-independent protein translocase protein TatA
MPTIGPMELIVVLALALIILGPKRLPDAGRSLGRGMREFREAISTKADALPDRIAAPEPAAPARSGEADPAEPDAGRAGAPGQHPAASDLPRPGCGRPRMRLPGVRP